MARLTPAEREKQIVAGAIGFFAQRGLAGQLRDLAKEIGVTHTLLYHYFPTKQALIERVYSELVDARWKPEWETLLDDRKLDIEEKFVRFYSDYMVSVLTHDFVRIIIFSGLTDRSIVDKFFAKLKQELLPRLIRETRRFHGMTSRAKPSARETELLLGLHGGLFYMGVRRFIYGQVMHNAEDPKFDPIYLRDRIRSYLLSWAQVMRPVISK